MKLDRWFVDAELRIATGLVEPHFMAGWSGGRKVVAPGVAHEDTIRTFHNARFMEDPAAIQCNLDGNPLHEEQLQIMRMLGEVHAVNTVIDERRRLYFVNFGEIAASHLEAVRFVRDSCMVPVGRKFSIVVTSAAGYPLDRTYYQTYYQTVKGMVTPIDILAPGASLVVASDCSEGIGSPQYREAQRWHPPLLPGPARRGPGDDRGERRRLHRGRGRAIRRGVGRSGGRGDPGGAPTWCPGSRRTLGRQAAPSRSYGTRTTGCARVDGMER